MERALEQRLSSLFGKDVKFDRVERKLYSHDVGTVPKLVKPFMPSGVAGAVVRPGTEEALIELVALADAMGVELVPRGSATSGYGGAVPRKDAVVVDMRRFDRIGAVQPDSRTITVQAGVVWKDLECVLVSAGLDLRLYPTSAPSSTVGGWLAQGGSGHGSFQYGWFRDNVVSARVVLPTGEVRDFSDDDLDVVSDAEGITGFITEVTFRVQPLEETHLLAVSYPNALALERAARAVEEQHVPLWSVGFINPAAVRLGKKMPAKTHHGRPIHASHVAPEVPESYVALYVWRGERNVRDRLIAIADKAGGDVLSDEIAEHEWELRYSPMRLKRLGPSLIPTEVVVPTASLGAVLEGMEQRLELPLIVEGVAVRGGEYVLLGFIPHDERTFGYNVAFGLSLSVVKLARQQGGRAYSTGIYFKQYADEILGADRVRRLETTKEQIDPGGFMNPGKVCGNGALTSLMSTAESFEPVVRSVANAFDTELGETFDTENGKGIPAEVAQYAYACAQCGYCIQTCTQFSGRGWESTSPRGKWYFLREVLEGRETIDQHWVDNFLMCTTCELCEHVCPLNLPIEPAWAQLRGELINEQGKMTLPPFEMMAASLSQQGNIWAYFKKDRADWMPEELRDRVLEKSEIAYFAGCTASYVEQDISKGSAALLDKAGIEFTHLGEDENCCGIPMLVAGRWDVWEENMKRNISAVEKRGVQTVVTSCPACYLVWKVYYRDWAEKLGIPYEIEAKHYTEMIDEKAKAGELPYEKELDLELTFHDSCHAGRACGLYEPPRDVLKSIPGVTLKEMSHNREDGLCCGSVLTLLGDTPVAHDIGENRLQEAVDIDVHDVAALCPCCQFQLRVSANAKDMDVRVHDVSHLVAEAMGVELPDPNPDVVAAWAVFDKMIRLMTPEEMAKLMKPMFPEMVDAMPMGMGKMMRALGRVPGAPRMMKPVMPKMFPMLMPYIMPKVMPSMIEAVATYMGDIPESMEELMPDLLPETMESLMPNMLPLLMPYIVPSMIECMRQGCAGRPEALQVS